MMVGERATWAKSLAQVKRMQQWVFDAEHILDGRWAPAGEVVRNATVGRHLDAWRQQLSEHLSDGSLSDLEREGLCQFLQVFSNLRSHLGQCSDRKDFPRTTNEMEGRLRGLKTRSRRKSFRKNWNNSLLRYGRCVAYSDWWEQDAPRQHQLVEHAARLDRSRWRQMRCEAKAAQSEHLKRFRFRHKRQAYLSSLEERWATASPAHLLP
jgi:hypothetical protein